MKWCRGFPCNELSFVILENESIVTFMFVSVPFRHVMLPKEVTKLVPKNRLMTENEWRGIGVQQSQGWIHYLKHGPGKLLALFVLQPSKFIPRLYMFFSFF